MRCVRLQRTVIFAAALATILTAIFSAVMWFILPGPPSKEPGQGGAPPSKPVVPDPVKVVERIETRTVVLNTHTKEMIAVPAPTPVEVKVASPEAHPAIVVVAIDSPTTAVPAKPPLPESSTALLYATKFGDHDGVKRWLAGGADPNAAESDGKTPLMFAAENGHHDLCKTLVSAGGVISKKDVRGRTALHYAAEGGHNDLVKYLLDHGASPDVIDNEGSTAFTLAQQGGHNATAGVIKKALLINGSPR